MPFRSKKQQRLFFATMPDVAKEWASKTDFSKLPEKARKKSHKKTKKDKSDCIEKTLRFASQYERNVKASDPVMLPDGSGIMVGSYPLPKDHWLFSEIEDILPIQSEDTLEKQRAAARYAIRATTDNGNVLDFDPDAMVINFLAGMR
jgi:hypothetical protein